MTRRMRGISPWATRSILWSMCLCVIFAVLQPSAAVYAQATPVLMLDPDYGHCDVPNPLIIARGVGFPAGSTVTLVLIRTRDRMVTREGETSVGSNGTFETRVRLAGCDPSEPEGSRFDFSAVSGGRNSGGAPLAGATFTVSSSPLPAGLPNTGGGWQAQASWPGTLLATWGIALLVGGCAFGAGRVRRCSRPHQARK